MRAGEIFGLRLLTLHNLWFLQDYMRKMRQAILEDRFTEFKNDFFRNYDMRGKN